MTLSIDLFRVVGVLNVVLLVGLGYVWGHNYAQFRSKHTLELLIFAVLLLLENALAVYFFVFEPTLPVWIATSALVPLIAQEAMLTLRVLEFGALMVLFWVTWD